MFIYLLAAYVSTAHRLFTCFEVLDFQSNQIEGRVSLISPNKYLKGGGTRSYRKGKWYYRFVTAISWCIFTDSYRESFSV